MTYYYDCNKQVHVIVYFSPSFSFLESMCVHVCKNMCALLMHFIHVLSYSFLLN